MKNESVLFLLPLFLISSFFVKIDFAKGGVDYAGCAADASILTVNADGSGDCETIQDAVDNIASGGYISVGDGTYQENLVITGKTFTLHGNVDTPSSVVLDVNYLGSGIDVQNIDADSGSLTIEGFTITNGRATEGAGMYIYNAYADINSCIFHTNDSDNTGGAITIIDPSSDVTIEKSDFHSNISSTGAAIYSTYVERGLLTIKNNLFYENNSNDNGGAVYSGITSYPQIFNNTFANNDADNNGGAIYVYGDSPDLKIVNNVFYNDSANSNSDTSGVGGGIYMGSYLIYGTIDYNSFYGNDNYDCYIHGSGKSGAAVAANNSTEDPLLTDAENNVLTLTSSSPLVDAGQDLSSSGVLGDYLGNPRTDAGYDIGAYEYVVDSSDLGEETPTDEPSVESTYCADNGGSVDDRTEEAVCVFTDGSECEIGLFYSGSCSIGDSLVTTDTGEDTSDESVIACGDFPDVNSEDFSEEECAAINWVQEQGIFTGNDETGELKPLDEINRAETTKVLIEAFGFDASSDDSTYSDVADGAWYTPYIMAATENSIVQGYSDGSFKPETTVNKVEMLKIILETAGADLSGIDTSEELFSDISVDESTDWYRKYAYYAYANELIDIDGDEFKPAEGMLREDVILVLYRLMGSSAEL